jgi:hypothetical protein
MVFVKLEPIVTIVGWNFVQRVERQEVYVKLAGGWGVYIVRRRQFGRILVANSPAPYLL